ncbi:MAG: hypothetical protein AAF623_20520, partial [Planctomycetota bacterium]
MAQKFNPFHKWFGLNPKLVNPNHFQLMGLSPLEQDNAKIVACVNEKAGKFRGQLAKVPPGKL